MNDSKQSSTYDLLETYLLLGIIHEEEPSKVFQYLGRIFEDPTNVEKIRSKLLSNYRTRNLQDSTTGRVTMDEIDRKYQGYIQAGQEIMSTPRKQLN